MIGKLEDACEMQPAVPLARVATLLRYTHQLRVAGAPIDRLLGLARIPSALLDHPEAVVPLLNAFRFAELSCQALGTEHLGLYVGLATSLDGLGPYGHILQDSLTLYDYLRKGISLYDMLITGQHLWLSNHGDELRLNITTIGSPELGSYQSHLETLVVTLAKFREVAGPGWSPGKISLAYRSREDLSDIELFAGSQVVRGTGETYFTFPVSLLALHFPVDGGRASFSAAPSLAARPLPTNLAGLVQLQIESLLPDRTIEIDTIAESLAMKRRSLQRSLAKQGLTYSQILMLTRIRLAAKWLARSDKPIAEIAFDLGYEDSSNFTRAFRREAGISPQDFRDNLKS